MVDDDDDQVGMKVIQTEMTWIDDMAVDSTFTTSDHPIAAG